MENHHITYLLHENISVIMTYAFSHLQLAKLTAERVKGFPKFFNKICFVISQNRANRAMVELAVLTHLLEDRDNNVKSMGKQNPFNQTVGTLYIQNNKTKELFIREFYNKVIHSSNFEWSFKKSDNPMLVCHSQEPKWKKAEVDIFALGFFYNNIGSGH